MNRRALTAGVATAVGIALLLAGAPRADAAVCPALDYQAKLATAAADLHRTPPDLAAAATAVTGLEHAQPGATGLLQPISDDLAAAPPDVADAQLRLDTLSTTLVHPSGSTCTGDTGAARGALHDVYAGPAFRNLDASNQSSFLDAVRSFFSRLVSAAAGALGPLGSALLAVAVVGLALLLVWRRWLGSAPLRGAAAGGDDAIQGDDPDAEWRRAVAAAAAGDHREAVRRAFRSMLIEVALRGQVHVEPAWTTRELLEHCRADGAVLAAMAPAAAVFEQAWYGAAKVTPSEWELAAERCMAVRVLARTTGVAQR